MSFFESFLGGAAQAGTGILQDQMKEEQAQRLAKFQEELAMERQRTINAMNQTNKIAEEDRAQERADAPLKRMGGIIGSYRGKEVAAESPESEAYQNMQLTGEGTGSGSGGFKGGIEQALISAQDIKDPTERKAALDQIQSQINYQSDGIRAAAPKTRKLTTDEAEQAALSEALANDPVAYAAYQAKIGAPRRAENREARGDRIAESRDKKMDADIEDRRARMDWEQSHKTEALELQREIARQKAGGGADAKDPSEVASTKWLMANKDDPVAMEMWNKVHQSKSKSIEDIAASFMEKDMTGSMTPAEAVKKATELSNAAKAMKQAKPDAPITQAEYAKLPSGAIFTAPDGTKRRKP